MISVTSDSDLPGGRLNEIVDATNWLWWFTASGVLPGPKLAIAESGIIVSFDVDTAAPVDALDLPLAAIELFARLRAASPATAAALDDVVPPVPPGEALDLALDVTVPAVALVDCEPLALPPDVLTHTCLSISGLCQYFGATSITT